MSKVIYAGFDESNHAGEGEVGRKGEIVTGIFSLNPEHQHTIKLPNTRNVAEAYKFLAQGDVWYFFTILTSEHFRYHSSAQNLSVASPVLVNHFLSLQHNDSREVSLVLNFDGHFGQEQKEILRRHFGGLESLAIRNFVKKQRTRVKKLQKVHYAPVLIQIADALANDLLYMPAQTLLSHPKYVPLPK
jgi:hypothetical protein